MDNSTETSPSSVATETEDTVTSGNQEDHFSADSIDSGQANTDADSAGSSDAGKDNDAKKETRSLLDVVKDAVKPEDSKGTSSASEDGKGETEKGAEPKQEKPKDGEEDLPPFHDHPRWKELQAKNAELSRDADQFRKVDAFMVKNDLNAVEVADGLKVMALMKKDPVRAREQLQQYIDDIDFVLGKKLPDDLQEKVDNGSMTEDAARELSITRQQKQAAESDLTTERTNRTTEAHESLKRNIASEMTKWESDKLKSDPDYSVKQPLVLDRVQAIIFNRKRGLSSVEDARAVGEQALKDVNEKLKNMLPKRTQIRNPPAGNNRPVSTEPKTLKDAIRAAVGG